MFDGGTINDWAYRDRNGFALDELNACGQSKFGVEPEHLDGEGELVRNVLTGTVPGRKQPEILRAVVVSQTINVMHGLFGSQRSSDNLFNDIAMEECLPRWFTISAGDDITNVAVSADTVSGVPIRKLRLVTKPPKQRSAFRAAQPFLSVDGPSWSPLNWHRFSALDTRDPPLLIGQLFCVAHATHGAIHRVSIPLLAIGRQVRLLHRKVAATLLAGEVNGWDARGKTARLGFEAPHTCYGTVLLIRVTGFHLKYLTALLARKLDWHVLSLVGYGKPNVAGEAM